MCENSMIGLLIKKEHSKGKRRGKKGRNQKQKVSHINLKGIS